MDDFQGLFSSRSEFSTRPNSEVKTALVSVYHKTGLEDLAKLFVEKKVHVRWPAVDPREFGDD